MLARALVRLTVEDLAGNKRQAIKRVGWGQNSLITDVYRAPQYISPNGDGVQDSAIIHYRVLEPVNLERASGRGLLLIRKFMTEVRHNEQGNEITLVLRT